MGRIYGQLAYWQGYGQGYRQNLDEPKFICTTSTLCLYCIDIANIKNHYLLIMSMRQRTYLPSLENMRPRQAIIARKFFDHASFIGHTH